MSLILLIIIIVVAIAIFTILKYEVEGEKNMPFNMGKIIIISSAVTGDGHDAQQNINVNNEKNDPNNINVNNEPNNTIVKQNLDGNSTENSQEEKYLWNEKVIQTNDVYIYIDKNENYKKDAVINSVKIENIQILESPKIGKIQVYMPNSIEGEVYNYVNNFLVDYSLTYNGALVDNKKTLEIGNQGGCICLSFANTQIGEYKSNEDKQIEQGAFILEKMKITDEDLKFSVSFDLIIDIGDKAYKGNIKLNLPVEGLVGNKESHIELTSFDTIFKRCKR